jgi:hypothetical protein
LNSNNRGNNNRRRGRGGNRQQGGGQQLNRIDSRARGNAPQLLEKYRKLAHDAHLNGDRVQEEYYLQFADHYFRVLADQRARQEEQRSPRRDERWQEGGEAGYRESGYREDGEEAGEFGGEGEYQAFDRPAYHRDDRPREPRQERQREERGEDIAATEAQGEADGDAASPFEPPENPFVRDMRAGRGLRPRRDDRRPRRDDSRDESREDAAHGLDSILPPAIAVASEASPAATPASRVPRRTRPANRSRPPADPALDFCGPLRQWRALTGRFAFRSSVRDSRCPGASPGLNVRPRRGLRIHGPAPLGADALPALRRSSFPIARTRLRRASVAANVAGRVGQALRGHV